MQKINFNAGPAQMPPEVLHEAAQCVKQYKKTGLSLLELPHRGKEFIEIIEESKALVKKLCGIGDEYEGAAAFAMYEVILGSQIPIRL